MNGLIIICPVCQTEFVVEDQKNTSGETLCVCPKCGYCGILKNGLPKGESTSVDPRTVT